MPRANKISMSDPHVYGTVYCMYGVVRVRVETIV